jgi:hypothetical protein
VQGQSRTALEPSEEFGEAGLVVGKLAVLSFTVLQEGGVELGLGDVQAEVDSLWLSMSCCGKTHAGLAELVHTGSSTRNAGDLRYRPACTVNGKRELIYIADLRVWPRRQFHLFPVFPRFVVPTEYRWNKKRKIQATSLCDEPVHPGMADDPPSHAAEGAWLQRIRRFRLAPDLANTVKMRHPAFAFRDQGHWSKTLFYWDNLDGSILVEAG